MDNLRLALIVVGVLLIGGIYFWEQRRRKRFRDRYDDWPRDFDAGDDDVYVDDVRVIGKRPRSEPGLGRPESPGPDPEAGDDGALVQIGDLNAIFPGETTAFGTTPVKPAPSGSAAEPDAATASPPPPQTSTQGLVVALTLMAMVAERFSGAELAAAMEEVGLKLGEQGVFQYFPDGKEGPEAVFSIANVLEPGTFDLDALDGFSTPGLVLFMSLPGPMDGPEAFELMLDKGRRLADVLGGELRDETRSSLTPQSISHLRERIGEYRRRQLLQTH